MVKYRSSDWWSTFHVIGFSDLKELWVIKGAVLATH